MTKKFEKIKKIIKRQPKETKKPDAKKSLLKESADTEFNQ